jgi:hypothetical protein
LVDPHCLGMIIFHDTDRSHFIILSQTFNFNCCCRILVDVSFLLLYPFLFFFSFLYRFGYVEYAEKETVAKALALSGSTCMGQPIIVQMTQAEKNRVVNTRFYSSPPSSLSFLFFSKSEIILIVYYSSSTAVASGPTRLYLPAPAFSSLPSSPSISLPLPPSPSLFHPFSPFTLTLLSSSFYPSLPLLFI